MANARLWSFNPSGRSLIQFVANTASSRMLKFASSRKSLISACCRYCGAWSETTFALDIQCPRTVRTCHSVGTECPREAGTDSSGFDQLPKLWDKNYCRNCEKSIWVSCLEGVSIDSGIFSEGIVHCSQPPNLSCLWSRCKDMFSAKDLIFCHGETWTVRLPYDFSVVSVSSGNS